MTCSHNIHDHSDFYTQVLCFMPQFESQQSREDDDVLNCGNSEQHGQFPRCIILCFVLNETSQPRRVTRGNKRRNVTRWGTERLERLTLHSD